MPPKSISPNPGHSPPDEFNFQENSEVSNLNSGSPVIAVLEAVDLLHDALKVVDDRPRLGLQVSELRGHLKTECFNSSKSSEHKGGHRFLLAGCFYLRF